MCQDSFKLIFKNKINYEQIVEQVGTYTLSSIHPSIVQSPTRDKFGTIFSSIGNKILLNLTQSDKSLSRSWIKVGLRPDF